MAKKKASEEIATKPISEMTLEEIQLATARAALQTSLLNLDDAEDANRKRLEKKERVKRYNEQLQADVLAEQEGIKRGQRICRHKQGGFPKNIFKGDSTSPAVFKTLLPDGFTYFIQCIRCRLKAYTPHPALEERDPKEYAKQKALYDKMFELSEEHGLDEIQTPNFRFRKRGVEFIPERV
jgi:hypothetical protein